MKEFTSVKKISQGIFSFFLIFNSFNVIAELRGDYWIVKSGDTLYGIARSIHPKKASLQAKLRTQIIKLNQAVFQKGTGGLYIGAKLVLPKSTGEQSNSVMTKQPKQSTSRQVSSRHLLKTNEWQIKSGDTLYSIARVFYPKSNRKQYKLRQEIIRINSDVFSGGANKMEVGLVMLMPEYLVKAKESNTEVVVVPVETQPINTNTEQTINTPKEIVKPVEIKTTRANSDVLEEESDRLKDNTPMDERSRVTNYQNDNNTQDSSFSVSLGYSVGGDVAVAAQGGNDVEFGSGGHLKMSYDRLWENKQGYRLSLGYQLDKITADNGSGEVKQLYLQTLYLYNTHTSLFGAGIAYHDNISLTTDISSVVVVSDYEPAIGFVMMYEYKRLLGNNIVGISYTQLETENSASLVIRDMSRTELYYRWAF